MDTRFATLPNRILLEKDGRAIFDSDAWPVQFFPSADAIEVTKTVSYPDFLKGNAYAYAQGLIGSDVYTSCRSYITMGYQEWGPGATNNLSAEVIGTVPAGTDLLMVMARITRTKAPSAINGNVPVVLPHSSTGWVMLHGGSLILEAHAPYARSLQIRLDGTNVVLERRQSVSNKGYSYWTPGNNPNVSGWTYGGTAGPLGHIVSQVQTKGPSFDPSANVLRRNGSSPCSLTDNTDYSSTYSIEFRIVPGRSDIDHTSGEFEGQPQLMYMGFDARTNTGSFTLSSKPIGAPDASRRVYVMVYLYHSLNSARDISSVTVGGVTASQVQKRMWHFDQTGTAYTSLGIGLYMATVPSGETGNIVVNLSGGTTSVVIVHYWVAYNQESNTPVASFNSFDSSNHNLATADGGFAIAGVALSGSTAYNLTGIQNAATFTTTSSSPTVLGQMARGFQMTTGSTLTINHDSGGNAPMIGASFR